MAGDPHHARPFRSSNSRNLFGANLSMDVVEGAVVTVDYADFSGLHENVAKNVENLKSELCLLK